ncbi:MAG: hypothetical protein MJZ82_00960 [Paludibacteraceae bacterium]|nr:hypothetical protein [Paludibacteraceae bacterium]
MKHISLLFLLLCSTLLVRAEVINITIDTEVDYADRTYDMNAYMFAGYNSEFTYAAGVYMQANSMLGTSTKMSERSMNYVGTVDGYVYFTSVSCTVTATEVGYTAVADCEDADGNEYHITFIYDETKGMAFDTPDRPFASEYQLEDCIISNNFEYMGYVGIYADNVETALNLVVYVADTTASFPHIPQGRYEVNESMESGSVLASSGVTENAVYPSYACTQIVEDGHTYSFENWYIRSGYLLVTSHRYILHAYNSYGQKITARIYLDNEPDPDDIEEPDGLNTLTSSSDSATKQLQDGRIVITVDGRSYDILGRKL